jgi:hypothetical protein
MAKERDVQMFCRFACSARSTGANDALAPAWLVVRRRPSSPLGVIY